MNNEKFLHLLLAIAVAFSGLTLEAGAQPPARGKNRPLRQRVRNAAQENPLFIFQADLTLKRVIAAQAVSNRDLCIAELAMTDGMVGSLKKGKEVIFTSINFQRAPNPIKISLQGFTGVFDGPAMEQSKLEERQRLLQEEMQKKAEEARKKLEDAQNAAKAQ